MSRDEDDDWDDEPDDDDDDGDVTNCPACDAEVYDDAESCPACGHWFLADDRAVMHSNTRRRGDEARSQTSGMMIKFVAALLVIVFLMGLLM